MALDPYNFYLMNFKKLEQLVPQIRVEGRLIFPGFSRFSSTF